MFWNDLGHTFLFYLIFTLCSLIGLPLVSRIKVARQPATIDMVSKVVGLLIFGYIIWLLASLHIISYQNHALVIVLFIVALIIGGYFVIARYRGLSIEDKKRFRKTFLYTELVSLILFYAYLYVRSYQPAIYGTERFMDMMLLNAAGKTNYFPPADSWYAGKTVNYYYYGSYLMSLLTNLSRNTFVLGYTSALGLLYSTASMLAGCFALEFTGKKSYAVLAAFLVTTAGMMYYAGCVMSGNGHNPPQVCSYASSTRFYSPSYIINEIPSYSFTVGDLHAHLLGLSFFISNLILLSWFFKAEKPSWLNTGLLGLGLASSSMINSWDAITLAVLTGIIVLYKYWQSWRANNEAWVAALKKTWQWVAAGAIIAVGIIILTLPFTLHFSSPVLGIRFIPSYVNEYNLHNVQWPTPLPAFLGEWGVFLAGIIWALLVVKKRFADKFPLLLTIVSLGIILGVELVFVPDIYSVANPPYFRANTVFKFGYHAWTMLALAFTVLLWMAFNPPADEKKGKRKNYRKSPSLWLPKTLLVLVVFFSLFYPYQALKQFYGWFGGTAQAQTLDGMVFMNTAGPGDYQAVEWIDQNIKQRSVILEAAGDSYQYFGRVSAFTGMIDPINWLTHEWTWRFDAAAAKKAKPNVPIETGYGPVAAVSQDVQTMYTSTDINQTEQLLQKYQVQYVYVGSLERTTYPSLDDQKFSQLGTKIYDQNDVQIYKITQ